MLIFSIRVGQLVGPRITGEVPPTHQRVCGSKTDLLATCTSKVGVSGQHLHKLRLRFSETLDFRETAVHFSNGCLKIFPGALATKLQKWKLQNMDKHPLQYQARAFLRSDRFSFAVQL